MNPKDVAEDSLKADAKPKIKLQIERFGGTTDTSVEAENLGECR